MTLRIIIFLLCAQWRAPAKAAAGERGSQKRKGGQEGLYGGDKVKKIILSTVNSILDTKVSLTSGGLF